MKHSRFLLIVTFVMLCVGCDNGTENHSKDKPGTGNTDNIGILGDGKLCELQGDICVSKGNTHCCRLHGVRAKIDNEARCLRRVSDGIGAESVCVLSSSEVCTTSEVLTCYRRKAAAEPDEIFVGSGSIPLQDDEPVLEECDSETRKSMMGLTYCTTPKDSTGNEPTTEPQVCKLEGNACLGSGNTHCCKLMGERVKVDNDANCLRRTSETPGPDTVCVVSASEVCVNSPMRTCYKQSASEDPEEFFLGYDRVTLQPGETALSLCDEASRSKLAGLSLCE